MVHTEFWGKILGPNSFFQGLNFPTIRHLITRNTITNLCTAMLSRLLVCKTILFDRGYFIQGAFTNIFQGLFKARVHHVNSNLQIGARGRLRVRVLSSEHAHFENFRPSNLKCVLSTENLYS